MNEPPICPECEAAGVKPERITEPLGWTSTCMGSSPPYWDEEGRRHVHDMNTTTGMYSCSNGHRWVVTLRSRCAACDEIAVVK